MDVGFHITPFLSASRTVFNNKLSPFLCEAASFTHLFSEDNFPKQEILSWCVSFVAVAPFSELQVGIAVSSAICCLRGS